MKSKQIILTIIMSGVLLSCVKQQEPYSPANKVYMRSDSTASYSRTQHHFSPMFLPMYHSFTPTGHWDNGTYHRTGYHSHSISHHSNVGSNPTKSRSVTRSGFGGSAKSHSVHS